VGGKLHHDFKTISFLSLFVLNQKKKGNPEKVMIRPAIEVNGLE
jgi:hypothetical protein